MKWRSGEPLELRLELFLQIVIENLILVVIGVFWDCCYFSDEEVIEEVCIMEY